MIGLIVLIVVLCFFVLASVEDIKKREVYDYINYSFLFFVLCIAIFDSIMNLSFVPIKYVGFGVFVGFALGFLLYYMGLWGGGDAKFLIGFSASIYYLMNYAVGSSYFYDFYSYFSLVMKDMCLAVVNMSLNVIVVVNLLFLILMIIRLVSLKNKRESKGVFVLFVILLSLTFGLYSKYEGFLLVAFGLLSFVLIFCADEEIFSLIYFRRKKYVSALKEGDRIDESIKINSKVIDVKEGRLGLTRENINLLEKNKDDYKVKVRQVIPCSYLVGFDYIMYIVKLVAFDEMNLGILGFLVKYLFYSFIVGGVIAILILFFYYVKNFRKVKVNFKKFEKVFLLVLLGVSIILFFVNRKISLLVLVLVFVFYFMKVAKQLEKLMFVKKKDLGKLTLGDWIVQDIVVKGKLIYASTDFKLGVDEKQLDKIKELAKTNKELARLYVKDGLAFLPPLFIGFLLMILI